MKRKYFALLLVVLLALALTSAAFAQAGIGNPKGIIESLDEACTTLTIQGEEEGDELFTVTLPEGFDCSGLEVGMYVVIKGAWVEDEFQVEWVKEADPEDDGEGDGNAWGAGGVYCAGGKEYPHPVAQKIADKYEITPEWVMERACAGYGFGEIMLALQTQLSLQTQAQNGEGGPDADELLDERKNGKGWGQIWKENELVKNDKAADPPPGWLNKEAKETGPKDEKGPDKGPDHPSNKEKPEKPEKKEKDK